MQSATQRVTASPQQLGAVMEIILIIVILLMVFGGWRFTRR
jgi:hypothetical protein